MEILITENAVDSIKTADITPKTKTGTTTYKYKKLRITDLLLRQLTTTNLLHMRIPRSLCEGLQSEKTSKPFSTSSIPNSTNKRREPRHYDDAPHEAQMTQENGEDAIISPERDLLSYMPLKFSATQ